MRTDLVVTGCGMLTAVGQGTTSVADAMFHGEHRFGYLSRPGREADPPFLGAEIPAFEVPAEVPARLLRTVGHTGRALLTAIAEAWKEARLADAEPARIGLVVGGSNVQQRELLQQQAAYASRERFIPPSHALTFMDTDLCGIASGHFGIRGLAMTVGGASASGQLAVIEASRLVQSGEVDICLAVGALADLSRWELQALRSLGAMGSSRFADQPSLACRPFDRDRDGFVYGEACAAIVIERADTAAERHVDAYATVAGWAVALDGNRNPDPSVDGESRAIQLALARAGLTADVIDYVNPHGTGSGIGDAVEVDALRACGLADVPINASKSIFGHALAAAGALEIVVTLLQMRSSTLHPTRNLENPVDPSLPWVGDRAVGHRITHALTLSHGFGGLSTAVCLGSVR